MSEADSKICDWCGGPGIFKHLPADKKEVAWLCSFCERQRLEVRSE
jgi:hypothetical protein